MDKFQIALDFYESVRKAFSESFPMIVFNTHTWGYSFNWPNLGLQNVNYVMITTDKSIDIIEIIKEMKAAGIIKLYSISKPDPVPEELNFKGKLGVFWRDHSNISFPIIEDGTIDQHYYRSSSNNQIDNIRSLHQDIAELYNIDNDNLIDFERYSGGLLHIQNGKIWTFKIENNLITTIMEIENDTFQSVKAIEFFITHDRFRNMGHGKRLLQALLSENKKTDYLIFGEINSSFQKIMEDLGFNKVGELFIHDLKK